MTTNLTPLSQEFYRTTHRLAHTQIKDLDVKRIKIDHFQAKARVEEVLPFRVQFINVSVFGYSKTNPPPIPLQVIGYSNYIL